MRIALIHTRLLRRGGLESRLLSYMAWFHAQGHTVTVFVHKVDPSVVVPEGVKVERLNLRFVPKPFRAPVFDWMLKRRLRQVPQDAIISLGRTTCHDAVVIAGVHRAFQQALNVRRFGISQWLQARMDARCYRAPGIMLPASGMIAAQMAHSHHADTSRMRVLWPPTDPERFNPSLKARKPELRAKHGIAADTFCFLFVSSNHHLKGLDVILAAFELLPPGSAQLLVVGGGPLPMEVPGARATGFVRETEELYAAADCTLLASRYDAFGQVITESLFCGTPVIVSHMTGAKDIVGPTEGLIVPSFEPKEWARAMADILAAPPLPRPSIRQDPSLEFQAHMKALLRAALDGREMQP